MEGTQPIEGSQYTRYSANVRLSAKERYSGNGRYSANRRCLTLHVIPLTAVSTVLVTLTPNLSINTNIFCFFQAANKNQEDDRLRSLQAQAAQWQHQKQWESVSQQQWTDYYQQMQYYQQTYSSWQQQQQTSPYASLTLVSIPQNLFLVY